MRWMTGRFRLLTLAAAALVVGVRVVVAAAGEPHEWREVGTVEDKRIDESSGLAVSRANPGHLWVHNDSGDQPRLFLIDRSGRTTAQLQVPDAGAVDWEDLCSFRMDDQNWLLVGDIGDNDENRGSDRPPCRLYLLKEPEIPQSNGQPTVRWEVFRTITYSYSDGPHNCESLAVDVARGEILLLTKEAPHKAGLYALPLVTERGSETSTANRLGSLPLPFATAMDLSPDSRTLAACTMWTGHLLHRKANQTWQQALSTTPDSLVMPPRKQGESLCFSADGRWLFANSEKKGEPLWQRRMTESSGPAE